MYAIANTMKILLIICFRTVGIEDMLLAAGSVVLACCARNEYRTHSHYSFYDETSDMGSCRRDITNDAEYVPSAAATVQCCSGGGGGGNHA